MRSITATRRGLDWRGLVLPAGLLAAWEIAAHAQLADPRILVPLDRLLLAAVLDTDARNLWFSIAGSVVRLAAGFAIGGSLGFLLGAALGCSTIANRLVAPSFNALRQIAVFAWIPLLTAWFGTGEGAKLAFIALSAGFPLALHTQHGFALVPAIYREAATVLRLSPLRRFRTVLLPAALPGVGTGLELGLIGAWLSTVTAEYAMGFGRGIGTFLSAGRDQFRMDVVILGVLALVLVGVAAQRLMRWQVRRLTPWQENAR
jgi:sulfonate transport system permease protein